jgi:hypothetical protein
VVEQGGPQYDARSSFWAHVVPLVARSSAVVDASVTVAPKNVCRCERPLWP